MELSPPYLLFLGDASDALEAKSAFGLLQWCPEKCLGVYRLPGCGVRMDRPDMSPADAVAAGAHSLVIGLATRGGVLRDAWRPHLIDAARRGLDIVSGLHQRLTDIPELVEAAREGGVRLLDVRRPPRAFEIASGDKRPGKRLLTVGTDGYVGKKFTALAITREMAARGFNVDFRATGQTGIMIAARGVAVDAVPGDFITGAVEWLAPANDPDHWDVIEGQGCILSPITSTSLGLINGAQADALVMCHDPLRAHMRGMPTVPVPNIAEVMDAVMLFARRRNPNARFVGVSLNTSAMDETSAATLLDAVEREFGLPVVDPIRTGVGRVVDMIPRSSSM